MTTTTNPTTPATPVVNQSASFTIDNGTKEAPRPKIYTVILDAKTSAVTASWGYNTPEANHAERVEHFGTPEQAAKRFAKLCRMRLAIGYAPVK